MGYAWINPNNEVFKAFLSAEDEALFNHGINDCTKVEIATSDIEKVFNDKAKFSVSDGSVTVTNIDPAIEHNAFMYTSKKEALLEALDKKLNYTAGSNPLASDLEEFNAFLIEQVDIPSLTIDKDVSFREYIMSVNNNKYWDPLQF
jgi:hypothetical protein